MTIKRALGDGIVTGRPHVGAIDRTAFRRALALCLDHNLYCECAGCLDVYIALKLFVDTANDHPDSENES